MVSYDFNCDSWCGCGYSVNTNDYTFSKRQQKSQNVRNPTLDSLFPAFICTNKREGEVETVAVQMDEILILIYWKYWYIITHKCLQITPLIDFFVSPSSCVSFSLFRNTSATNANSWRISWQTTTMSMSPLPILACMLASARLEKPRGATGLQKLWQWHTFSPGFRGAAGWGEDLEWTKGKTHHSAFVMLLCFHKYV